MTEQGKKYLQGILESDGALADAAQTMDDLLSKVGNGEFKDLIPDIVNPKMLRRVAKDMLEKDDDPFTKGPR
jgi:hypothetical protein